MPRFLAAVAVVLAVLAGGALIVAAVVSRVAPLAAKLEAWWARRNPPIGAAGRPEGKAAGSVGGDTVTVLAATQADDPAVDGGGASGFGDVGGFGDGGAAGGGDGG